MNWEGVSGVSTGIPHRPPRTWFALMAVSSEALPMTASCLSSLPGVRIPAEA